MPPVDEIKRSATCQLWYNRSSVDICTLEGYSKIGIPPSETRLERMDLDRVTLNVNKHKRDLEVSQSTSTTEPRLVTVTYKL